MKIRWQWLQTERVTSLSNEARIAFVAYGVDTLNETANPYYVVTELVSAEEYV